MRIFALLPLARPPAAEQPTRDWSAREQDEAARQAALRWTLAPDTNLIFISIDTLRADHMSLHGYPRVTTPFLDELAGQRVHVSERRIDEIQASATQEAVAQPDVGLPDNYGKRQCI